MRLWGLFVCLPACMHACMQTPKPQKVVSACMHWVFFAACVWGVCAAALFALRSLPSLLLLGFYPADIYSIRAA